MKVAIIGSRGLTIADFTAFLPPDTSAIISGGACGVDESARRYACEHAIPLIEYLPDYAAYGRAAPLRRNEQIVAAADLVLAFWDGESRGTCHTVRCARRCKTPVTLYIHRAKK